VFYCKSDMHVRPMRFSILWEYIFQLLEKIRFPLIEIEGIAERRVGMVDFRCSSRKSAVALAEALSTRHEVSFAKVWDPEYIDVKFNWVPADFPDGRIKDVLERLYGEIRHSRKMKDRRGKADGSRIYSLKTEALKLKPIPATVRLSGRVFLVEYTSQTIQFFVCNEFGHIRWECPNYSPAKLPPAKEPGIRDPQEPPDCAISEGASSNSASHDEDQPKGTSETSGTTDDDGYTLVKRPKTRRVKKLTLQTLFQNINSPSASNGMDAAQAVNQVTHDQDPEPSCTEESCRLPTSTPRVTTEPCSITDEVNPILPTSTEDDVDGEQIDDAATAEITRRLNACSLRTHRQNVQNS